MCYRRTMSRAVLLAVLLVACKEDKGPPCPQIVDHMLEITKQQMPGHDPDSLGDKRSMIAECEKRKMAPSMRKCLMAAKTLAALSECRSKAKPVPTAPPAGAPAPAPTGSGSGG
jgi:hypothetical protein